MKSSERSACIRVFTDLILADSVIDAGEMACYDRLRADLRLTQRDESQARSITLAEAVDTLRQADDEVRSALLPHLHRLSVSDGFGQRFEALLITAVSRALHPVEGEVNRMYSFPKHLFDIPTGSLIYIEDKPEPALDTEVGRDYRALFAELRMAGLDFIHIPHVVAHYRAADPRLLDTIVRFVAPGLSDEGRHASVEKLLAMTTAEFTKDILCNKLGMDALRGTGPALLLKTGSSFVGDMVYANYLRIDIDPTESVTQIVRRLLDEYTPLLNTDMSVVDVNREHRSQFLYSGFYKLLLDTHLMRRHVRSRVVVNPYAEEIRLVDIDASLQGLHRREKALYLTMLLLSMEGGSVDFTAPADAREAAAYNRRMERVQRLYAHIYGLFGGDSAKAPDLSLAESRRPMLSLIKRQLTRHAGELHNAADYIPAKDASGAHAVHLEPELVAVHSARAGRPLSLADWRAELAILQPGLLN